ncbi:MAG: FprA family A-type flavoprotein [Coriobacteriales bacterium]|jgi:flavorubredoxin|nr:FprA family A-type flavoprotein [Coriobacteriales bacterium]
MDSVTPSVLITSVLNPNMRIFDVVMRTEYGTSYNSYAVIGSEKIALVDSSHLTFCEAYFDHLDAALAGRVPDYLVMNHTEPDHSGTVAALVERYPDIIIVISQAGAIYLKNITNRADLKLQIVKDGDSLDLGGKTLHFMIAPFLHWPDTMFTWLPEEKVVFTCDFLGAHYCEPQLFDSKVTYREAYVGAVKNYFDCIFGPFKGYVLKGLDRLATIDPQFVCTSHGPILTAGVEYQRNLERYRQWATVEPCANKRIPVFYCSAYGNTERLASHVARGLLRGLPSAEVTCYDLNQHDLSELAAALNDSDAFLLGSPTINRDALPPVWNLLACVDAVAIAKRPVALFGSYGWSGEAIPHLTNRLTDLKAAVFADALRVQFTPTADDLAAAEKLGEDFARSLPAGCC